MLALFPFPPSVITVSCPEAGFVTRTKKKLKKAQMFKRSLQKTWSALYCCIQIMPWYQKNTVVLFDVSVPLTMRTEAMNSSADPVILVHNQA